MNYVLPLIIYILFNVWPIYLFKKKFGETIIFSFIFMSIFSLILTLIFRKISIAYYLILILSALSLPLAIIKWKDVYKNIFCAGFVAFLVIYIFVIYLNYDGHYIAWDEFAHWGRMLREMLRTDELYNGINAPYILHREYPPFMQILEYLNIKFSFIKNGFESETFAKIIVHLLLFSFIPYVIDTIENNSLDIIKKIIVSIIFLLVILNLDIYGIFSTIYVDMVLGSLFGISLIVATRAKFDKNSIYDYILLVSLSTSMILLKETGIFFSFIASLLYLLKNIKFNTKFFVSCLILFIVPVGFFIIWKIYLGINQIVGGQFAYDISLITKIFDVLSGNMTDLQSQCFETFKNAFSNTTLFGLLFKFSYRTAIIVCLFFIAIIFLLNKMMKTFNKESAADYVKYGIVITIGAILYAAMLLITYLFFESENDMIYLGSYTRYSNTYFQGVFIFIIYLIYFNLKNNKLNYIVMFILLLTINFDQLAKIIPLQLKIYNNLYKNVRNISQQIGETSDDNLLIIKDLKSHIYLDNDPALPYYFSDADVKSFPFSNNGYTDPNDAYNEFIYTISKYGRVAVLGYNEYNKKYTDNKMFDYQIKSILNDYTVDRRFKFDHIYTVKIMNNGKLVLR